jgi:hypothetical protein
VKNVVATAGHEQMTRGRRVLLLFALAAWRGFALVWAAAVLFWIAGRVLTDSFRLTQYAFWMPGLVLGAAGIPVVGVALVCRGLARRWRGDAKAGTVARGAILAFTISPFVVAAWAGGANIHRSKALASTTAAFRLTFWNDSEGRIMEWEQAILAHDPDLSIMKPGVGRTFTNLVAEMSKYADPIEMPAPGADFVYTHGFAVVSKMPIKRWSVKRLGVEPGLGLDPRTSDFRSHYRDPGNSMVLELGTRERLGRDIIVWLIDLPSDPTLWRMTAMREAAATLGAGFAPIFEKDSAFGRWRYATVGKEWGMKPDLIVGDFNTPRGSASLKEITRFAGPGVRHAWDDAGSGYCGSYPREWALWHIDHVFVGEGLRALEYKVVNPGGGSHRMQVAEIAGQQ